MAVKNLFMTFYLGKEILFYRGTKQNSPLEIWNLLSEITEY